MTPIRRLLCNLFCNHKEEPAPPFSTPWHRSGMHVRQHLRRQFPNAQIKIRDENLSTPSISEFKAWLKKDLGNYKKYHKDWYDCDDYAIELRHKMFKFGHILKTTLTVAYCEGYTGSDYHAYNLVIDNKDAIYIIEPQDDNCTPADESIYRTDFIQI